MIRVIRETHHAPPSVARRLELAGGRNRFGEPNYRAVWGWSRLGWIGGKWTDRDAEGKLVREVAALRRVPKYAPHDRWHIERWLSPETYGSPREWYAQTIERQDGIDVRRSGRIPLAANAEHCFTLEGPQGEFVQLTPTVAEYIARAIEAGRLAGSARRREAIAEREQQRERQYDAYAWDALSSASRAFDGAPSVAVL